MTPEQLQILATELAQPEYAALSDADAAQILNDTIYPSARLTVTSAGLKAFTFTKPIICLVDNAPKPMSLWKVIKLRYETSEYFEVLMDVFTNSVDVPLIDFYVGGAQRTMLDAGIAELVNDPSIAGFINNAGVTIPFDEAGGQALLAEILALSPLVSRATQLNLPTVYYYEVGQAREL